MVNMSLSGFRLYIHDSYIHVQDVSSKRFRRSSASLSIK